MSATAMHALQRLSVFRFGLDRLDDAVQDPSFRALIEQGWRPVIVWAVEDDRSRSSLPPALIVVMAPPLSSPPAPPLNVTVAAPVVKPTAAERTLRFVQPVLLAAILLVLLVQG